MESILPHIEAPKGELAIELISCHLEIRICGPLAETIQTMVFRNPNSRALEGTLFVPLPPGAVVCGYAIDVNAEMLEGVVVAKEEARRILEAEVRKGVDPGLVEKVQGNLYRTRLYPLPALSTRTVRLTYTSELELDGASAAYRFRTPAEESGPNQFDLDVQVVSPVQPDSPQLRFELHQGIWAATTAIPAGGEFLLRLADLPPQLSAIEHLNSEETFFLLSIQSEATKTDERDWKPKRLGLAWDASGSRRVVEREIKFLKQLFERWPYCGIDVVVVRNEVEPMRSFLNLQAAALYLAELAYDGSSELGLLNFEPSLAGLSLDAWLLFSDGLATSPVTPKTGTIPIFTICSQPVQNSAFLRYLSELSGATYINLVQSNNQRALELLEQGPQPTATFGPSQTEVHCQRTPGRLQFFGRLTPDRPSAKLSLGARTFEVHRDSAPSLSQRNATSMGRLLARAWAAHQAAALELEPSSRALLVELGRRYQLVTAGTSLLVLESIEQYLEYELEPPNSLPQLQEAFRAHQSRAHLEREQQRVERLDQVAYLWKQRVEWWEQDFRPQWETPREAESPKQSFAAEDVMSFAAACPAPTASFCAEDIQPMCASESSSAAFDDSEGGEVAQQRSFDEVFQGPTTSIKGWDPQTPYLVEIKAASDAYQAYLRLIPSYQNSPSFFLDCSDYLLKAGQRQQGLCVLSNLSELALGEPGLLRIQSWRLQQSGELDRAIRLLEEVLQMRPDEPQSYRDLALALGDRFERDFDVNPGQAVEDAERSAALLYEVTSRQWERFPEIEIIALMELNRLLDVAELKGINLSLAIDARLRASLALDLRISLAWDADLTDVDLHVTEPTEERASYRNQNTRIGGRVSRDFRDGYGPEEYVLRRAYPGLYSIYSHYYGSHQQSLIGPCTVLATVFTNYARPTEQREYLTLRLDQPSQEILVGSVNWA